MAASNVEFRNGVTKAYREYVIGVLGWKVPAVTSAAELVELAKKIDTAPLEAEHGLRTEPPFPGLGDTPEETPTGWRMNCASRLFLDARELGVIFMTFHSGKSASIVFDAPGTPIPEEYSPIASR